MAIRSSSPPSPVFDQTERKRKYNKNQVLEALGMKLEPGYSAIIGVDREGLLVITLTRKESVSS